MQRKSALSRSITIFYTFLSHHHSEGWERFILVILPIQFFAEKVSHLFELCMYSRRFWYPCHLSGRNNRVDWIIPVLWSPPQHLFMFEYGHLKIQSESKDSFMRKYLDGNFDILFSPVIKPSIEKEGKTL